MDGKNYQVSEIFPGIQGEGKTVGTPVVFVRLYGCNLRCEWCDSLYAIEGSEYTLMSAKEIMSEIKKHPQIKTVVFTGGEPLIQLMNSSAYDTLFNALEVRQYKIEIETNGILLNNDFIDVDYITQYNISPKFESNTTFDWRVKYLNKEFEGAINNIKATHNYQIKFVLESGDKREQCIANIKEFIDYHKIPTKMVYIMSEGQTQQQQNAAMKDDLELCLNEGWNYTPRLHILVYDEKRGV
jgi:organic radical activating enzyme